MPSAGLGSETRSGYMGEGVDFGSLRLARSAIIGSGEGRLFEACAKRNYRERWEGVVLRNRSEGVRPQARREEEEERTQRAQRLRGL